MVSGPRGVEAGQELELHVAEVALGAQLLFDLVLEQADGFGEHEVGPQLLGIEPLRRGTGVSTGAGATSVLVPVSGWAALTPASYMLRIQSM